MTDRTDGEGQQQSIRSTQTVDAVDEHIRDELVGFIRALRRAGASVPANAAMTAARSLAEVGLSDRDRVRIALRASLLTDRDDFETFERLFEEFWRRLTSDRDRSQAASDSDDAPEGSLAPLGRSTEKNASSSTDEADDETVTDSVIDTSPAESFAVTASDAGGADDAEAPKRTAGSSPSGRATPVERVPVIRDSDLSSSFQDLTRALAALQGRRFRRGTDRPDVRRALRASVSTGGTVLTVPKRQRERTAVRARFVVDVSQSVLDTVDRGFLIDFLRRACEEWRDVQVFFFDEDLREVTGAIEAPSAAEAMRALEDAETVWGGGTRIGTSLAALRKRAPEAVDRRSVVFVVSDALETGDVSALEQEASRLSRRAGQLFWLNPLATVDGYEPAVRGMTAVLPFLDGLFAFATLADVVELARQLRLQGPGGRVGYEFDTSTAERPTDRRRTRGDL